MSEWQPIETAPRDGTMFIAYRPLAWKSQDPVIRLVRGLAYSSHLWECTIPEGMDDTNFTDGSCKATHWHPLPLPPGATP